MKKINFSETLMIGHPEIDGQHENLIQIINRLIDHHDEGGLTPFKILMKVFLAESKKHFRSEEKIMTELGFVRTTDHRKHHGESLLSLKILTETLEQTSDMKHCIHEIIDVLINDMIRHDMDFGTHLKKINFKETDISSM